jgi:hypothetical protein
MAYLMDMMAVKMALQTVEMKAENLAVEKAVVWVGQRVEWAVQLAV